MELPSVIADVPVPALRMPRSALPVVSAVRCSEGPFPRLLVIFPLTVFHNCFGVRLLAGAAGRSGSPLGRGWRLVGCGAEELAEELAFELELPAGSNGSEPVELLVESILVMEFLF